MLVLTLKSKSALDVFLNDEEGPDHIVTVKILEVSDNRVKLGFVMDDDVGIVREDAKVKHPVERNLPA